MRKIALIAAAFLALATPATAADKGGPPATLEQLINMKPKALSGCFVEAGLAGTFLAAGDRAATGVIGMGCDAKLNVGIIGAGFRGHFGDNDVAGGSVYGKLGFALNPNVGLYGLIEWRVKDWRIKDVGQLHLGAGLETTLFVDGLSGFIEATTGVSKFGPGVAKDDIGTLVGLRWRL